MPDGLKRFLKKHKRSLAVLAVAVVSLDAVLWWGIAAGWARERSLVLDFLAVGQGDSELVRFPGGATMLIDGGPPDGRVLEALGEALPATARTIDLVILSHPQTDHFGGLIEVIRRYRVGAFVSTRVPNSVPGYPDLIRTLDEEGVPRVTLRAGDVIRYGEARADVLAPTEALLVEKDVNETTLVLRVSANGRTALFTGDADAKVESLLASVAGRIDVLKVAHHGSKLSSTASFLRATSPAVAVIEVGKNTYGHPTPEALARLSAAGAAVFRTDTDGTVRVVAERSGLSVFAK